METALRLEETWEHDGKAWLQRTPTDEGDRDLISHQCRVWGFRTLGSTGGGRNMVTVETEAPALRRMLPATATPSSLDKHASPLLYVPPPHRSPSTPPRGSLVSPAWPSECTALPVGGYRVVTHRVQTFLMLKR